MIFKTWSYPDKKQPRSKGSKHESMDNQYNALKIVVRHQTFSEQNCWLSEGFWLWSDKMSRQTDLTEYDFITLYACTL